MKIEGQQTLKIAPLIITLLLILWTMAVSPFSHYGDNWAIYPALLMAPLVLLLHLFLIVLGKGTAAKLRLLSYALIHGAIFFFIWINCLMRISKDSL